MAFGVLLPQGPLAAPARAELDLLLLRFRDHIRVVPGRVPSPRQRWDILSTDPVGAPDVWMVIGAFSTLAAAAAAVCSAYIREPTMKAPARYVVIYSGARHIFHTADQDLPIGRVLSDDPEAVIEFRVGALPPELRLDEASDKAESVGLRATALKKGPA